jgi:hypothetical protein
MAVFGRTNSVWDDNISNDGCAEEIRERTSNWHHLVATYNSNGKKMKLYRDGDLQESDSGDAVCSGGTPSVQDIGDLFIGKDFIGKIDDLIIFNEALKLSEVRDLRDMGTCCSNQ